MAFYAPMTASTTTSGQAVTITHNWQEQLHRLDADLANGKVSLDEHKRLRERLLARAAAAGEFPVEADKPAAQGGPSKAADTPRRRVPAQELLHTERPTSAPSPADADTGSFRVQSPAGTDEPPARRSEPVPPSGRPQPRRRNPRLVLVGAGVGLVVLLAALIGGLVWTVTSVNRDGDDQQRTPEAVQPTDTRQSRPMALADRLDLPGAEHPKSGRMTVAEGTDEKLFGADEALVLRRAGVRDVMWKGSSGQFADGTAAYVVLVAESKNPEKAKATSATLQHFGRSRIAPAEPLRGYADVAIYQRISADAKTIRAIYTSKRNTVRVGVVHTPGTDQAALRKAMDAMLKIVTAELPPDGR